MKALLKTADQKPPYSEEPKRAPTSTQIKSSTPYRQPKKQGGDPPKLKFKSPDPPNKVNFKTVKSNSSGNSKKGGGSTTKILKAIQKDSQKESKRANNDSAIQPQ